MVSTKIEKSNAKVAIQYGITLQPITFNAYLRLYSLSSTGKVTYAPQLNEYPIDKKLDKNIVCI